MLQQKRPLATLKTKLDSKGQSGPHRPSSLLVPLTAFVIDNQMETQGICSTCPPGLCAIKCLTGLQWQPGLFFYAIAATTSSLKTAKILTLHKGPTWG